MKKLFAVLTIILGSILIYKLGLAFGGMSTVVTVLLFVMAKYKIDDAIKLREYGKRFENVYVVSLHPKTEEPADIRPELDRLIVWSKYHDVIEAVRREEADLLRSGNTFFTDPGLTVDQRLKVIPIIFRSGEFVNESWKDFRHRVKATIEADRVAVHSSLKEQNPDWYFKFANNQNGVEWNL